MIEAMKQALEALKGYRRETNEAAITALRQAIEQAEKQQVLDKKAENARELGLDYYIPCCKDQTCPKCVAAKQEPWVWQQAPIKTQWGDDMVVADLAIDKDHTVSVYCERDQTARVEAMFRGTNT